MKNNKIMYNKCTSSTTIPYNLFSSGTTSSFGDNLLNDRKIKITKINNIIKNKKYQKIISCTDK